MEPIKVKDAAKALGVTSEYVRWLLRAKKVDWGIATQRKAGGKWKYLIYPNKFKEVGGSDE